MTKISFLAVFLFFAAFSTLSAQEEEPTSNSNFTGYKYSANKYKLGDEWQSFISPGAGYSVYIPTDKDSLGIFSGISTQFIWYTTNSNVGKAPSNFQLYTRISILKSNKENIGGLISYVMGGTFSFERNVSRAFFIPYFGIEFGGINQRGSGSGFQIAPVLGAQLVCTPYVMLNVQAGYTYSTREFDKLSGIQANAGLNFFFWGH